MDTLPTQLAIPGQYVPLHRNMIAPSLRKQINNANRILHTNKKILDTCAFREDEFTSKMGGMPCWLPPSPQEGQFNPKSTNPATITPKQRYTQPMPVCPGCKATMMLVTQTFSPIDFITNLDGFDSNKPIISCYSGTIIKKYAAMKNLHSTAPDTQIIVSRHARTVYVFVCGQGLCANNPGAWKTVSMVQSVPKEIVYGPNGMVIIKPKKIQQNSNELNEDDNDDNDDDIDDDYDEDDDADEDGELDDIDMEDDDDDENEKDKEVTVPLPPPQNTQNNTTTPSTSVTGADFLTQKKSVVKAAEKNVFAMPDWSDDDDDDTEAKTTTTTTSKKDQNVFAVGGWSDDDEDPEEIKKKEAENFAKLQKMVQETQLLQQKASGKSEKAIQEKIDKAKQKKKNEKLLQKGQSRAPFIIETKTDVDINDDDYVQPKASSDDVTFFRPFYIWWSEETKAKVDLSREAELLRQYYLQADTDDVADDGINQNDDKKKSDDNYDDDDDNGNDDDDDEDDQDDDPYDTYQDCINYQPDQVLRYFNSNLTLHTAPSAAQINKFRNQTKSHALQKYTTQSGMWLLHDVPKCKGCGEVLTLECQILPTLLYELKPDEFEAVYHRDRYTPTNTTTATTNNDDIDNVQDEQKKAKEAKRIEKENRVIEKRFDLDWGIINIYSCLNMCTPDEYMTGFCLVQPSM